MCSVAKLLCFGDARLVLLDGVRERDEKADKRGKIRRVPHTLTARVQGLVVLGTHLRPPTTSMDLFQPQQLHSGPQLHATWVPPTMPPGELLHARKLSSINTTTKSDGRTVVSQTTRHSSDTSSHGDPPLVLSRGLYRAQLPDTCEESGIPI
ncbi:MAG: hypothetical protein L6R36_006528 [Xanthoria steineri]|nr:MAG: hypothetical protein L6R36_006528 [Xanthoria steineri]